MPTIQGIGIDHGDANRIRGGTISAVVGHVYGIKMDTWIQWLDDWFSFKRSYDSDGRRPIEDKIAGRAHFDFHRAAYKNTGIPRYDIVWLNDIKLLGFIVVQGAIVEPHLVQIALKRGLVGYWRTRRVAHDELAIIG